MPVLSGLPADVVLVSHLRRPSCSQPQYLDGSCQNYRYWRNWPDSCKNDDCLALPGPHPNVGYSNWDDNQPGQDGGKDNLVFDGISGRWKPQTVAKKRWVVCAGICPPSAPPEPPPAPPPLLPYPPSPPCETIVVALYNPCKCSWSDFSVSVGDVRMARSNQGPPSKRAARVERVIHMLGLACAGYDPAWPSD